MRRRGLVSAVLLCLAALLMQGCSRSNPPAQQKEAWKAPDPATIPEGPVGDSINLGQQLFLNTPRFAPQYVGNRMNCADCHAESGTVPFAAPMVGLTGMFPVYNARAGRVITLEDRIQECFTRSENGRPLPYNSKEMIAIVAYIQWLSQGQAAGHPFPGRGLVKLPELRGDPERGAVIYAQQCAGCHGAEGKGDPPVFPPLWGPDSYNDGAGMNQVTKMAAFVQHNMPLNHPGTLTAREAFDVAAYVASKPRPRFNSRYAIY
jgi:thiosulfate dehydrogenase